MVDRPGATVSYVAFNMKDPILSKRGVRLAIAHAIDRESIVRNLIRGQGTLASSFLEPSLSEALPFRPFSYDPSKSEALLDAAGYPRGKDGVRLRLKYKSTNTKYGLEYAQIIREMLGRIGIAIELDAVETSVFFASIRKGAFQMYISRWVGVSDGSIYRTTLYTGQPDNRVRYSDPQMDAWLDASLREVDPAKRKAILARVQEKMLDELPYFPLWFWTNALTFRDTILPPKPESIPLSGAYDFLAGLRFRE
jgi:peptide/nickel transport system substrate-binding protein